MNDIAPFSASAATNLAALLAWRAREHPMRPALRFLGDGETVSATLTFSDLDAQARELAGVLASLAGVGERAMLLYPSGPAYAVAFTACLYAGLIAVPAYPPESASPQHTRRLRAIAADAEPALILTEQALAEPLAAFARVSPALRGTRVIATDTIRASAAHGSAAALDGPLPVAADAVAFLQYTSGSTAQPKGVRVTHGNLLANETCIRAAFSISAADTIVTWLPLYHDMGLIGGLLQPLFSGVDVVLMSPRHFLERPVRWLKAISEYGGTVSGGPDFAFRLCTERITPEQVAGLDLSAWQLAFCGSEPVRDRTLREFADRFAGAGFDARALYPCYGLAEATLLVSGGRRGGGVRTATVQDQALAQHRWVEQDEGRTLVANGAVPDGHKVRIVDPQSAADVPEGGVGEIWVSGPSVADGYWNNQDATAAAFVPANGAVWLRTGDLGTLRAGELYVTGRRKDLIIVRGQNLYPQDIEAAVEEEIELVRKGRVAAFGVQVDGREGIGVAAEIGRSTQKLIAPQTLAQAIADAVAGSQREPASVVLLLNPGALPKTTSGKLQRAACLAGWERGELDHYASFRVTAAGATAIVAEEEAGTGREGAIEGPFATPERDAAQALAPGLESAVAAIWSEVLRTPVTSANSRFFALGGSSLLAAQAAAAMGERLGREIDLAAFFDGTTLREFCAGIAAAPAAVPTVRPAGSPLRPSAAQRRMWFMWKLEPLSAAYHIVGSLALPAGVEQDRIQQALRVLGERHDVLRSRFPERKGECGLEIAAQAPIALDRLDAGAGPTTDAVIRAYAARPFDLEHGPVWRVALLTGGKDTPRLVAVLHHIVADGASTAILMRDFMAVLAAPGQAGPAAATLPPRLTYADYAAWQQSRLEGGEQARQLAFWTARLDPATPALALPTDHPRPAQPTGAGTQYRFSLPPELAAALRRHAREQAATPFMILKAVFDILLHRYTGQRQIRVGVPFANRPHAATRDIVGLFVNTLVLQSAWQPQDDFNTRLRQVRDDTRLAQAHADLPFEQLVQALNVPRIAGQHPVFQVMFNHLDHGDGPRAVWEDAGATKFDLGLNTEETRDGAMQGAFVYDIELFEPATIERLAGHYVSLLRGLLAQPGQAVGEIPLLDTAERAVLLAWGQGTETQDSPPPVHTQIAIQAERTPAAVALQYDGQNLTYRALQQRVQALSAQLRRAGVVPRQPVGVLLPRSLNLPVALLAILHGGSPYVPLDPDHPPNRLAQMVEDAGIALILADGQTKAALPPGIRVAVLDVDTVTWSHDHSGSSAGPLDDLAPTAAVQADDLAYILYTSGTTGRPKPVGNTYGALARRLAWMQSEYALQADETLLQKTPLGFDVSVWEIFWPLTVGARLVLAEPGAQRDPHRLAQLVREHGVSTMHFVPSLLRQFIADEASTACTSLRRLYAGGEALTADLRDAVLQRFPGIRFDNRYGPTEALINATCWTCSIGTGARVPIGRPLPDTETLVLDDQLNLVPPGVTGHLYLGGATLARGYLGRPGLTAERFVPHPYASGRRLYRSGDLARWRADGLLEYLGRLDHQVKVRGVRIELGEVEAALDALPEIRQAAVVAVPGPDGGARLVAYVVGPDIDVAALGQGLARQLPGALLPAQFIPLPALPLMANGKVDRAALPAPTWTAQAYRPVVTPLQQDIADVWREVLGVEQVGLGDRFFDLGGHSLLATQVVARLRKRLGTDLPLRALFDARDLEDYAELTQAFLQSGRGAGHAAPRALPRDGDLPLSHSQERMWFLWDTERSGAAYNVGGLVRLRGTLDRAALQWAVDALVARHEGLRTTFPARDGKPVQRIAPAASITLTSVDLQARPRAEREARLDVLARAEAHAPFDLEQGPLLRLHLVRLDQDEHALLVAIHHIVAEGWAMEVFADELAALYRARAQPRTQAQDTAAALPALSIQYPDFSVWQRDWLAGGEGARQLEYWKRRLGSEHPVLVLPTDHPRPATRSYAGDTLEFELPAALHHQVRAFNQRHHATLFMTVAASLFALLYRYSGQRDLRLGYPIANRTRPEFERIIGGFLNTQVLQCDADGALSAAQWVAAVRASAIDAQAHQDVPFHQIVDALRPERSASHTPLFQVMCNVQRWRFQQTREVAPGLSARFVPNDSRTSKFDLMLDVTDIDDRLSCMFTYSTELFERATIERMAAHWRCLLEAMVRDEHTPVAALPMVAAAARPALLQRWNPAVPRDAVGAAEPLHVAIEARARSRPDAIAASAGAVSLSYGELNARANQLARHLRALGAGPECLVGLAVARSLDTLVGMLAVLKAGAAYLPMDPDYPADHLAWLAEDARPRVVLTQADLLDALPMAGPWRADCRIWCFDRDGAELAAHSRENPDWAVHPLSAAYCIYTSGSTGRPKGTLISHANATRLFTATAPVFHFGPDDVWTLFHSYAFDFSVWEVFGALRHGGRVVIVPYGVSRDPDAFLDLLHEEGVTVLNQTPSAFRQLLQARGFLQRVGGLSLRHVIFGGEALDMNLLGPWFAQLGTTGPRLTNMYGITETTVHVTHRALSAEDGRRGWSAIGTPIADLRWYVLDEALEPVPAGVIGELYIGGAGLARGYLGRAALTAQRFVPDPYADPLREPGARLYRSGDLARWRDGGGMEYVGRADSQMKIRGYRIEPGEIESALRVQVGVADAVVVLRHDTGQPRLVAYLVPARGVDTSRDALAEQARRGLADALPAHMVPHAFVVIDALPLTVNGKLDRKRLPTPEAPTERHHVAPDGAVQEALARIWQTVLDLPRVGAEDNFFEVGGDSISAVRMAGLARDAGLVVTPTQLFQHQTIAALARQLTTNKDASVPAGATGVTDKTGATDTADAARIPQTVQAVITAQAGINDTAYPLTPMQEGIVFHSRLEQGQGTYVVQCACDIHGDLDIDAFKQAWRDAVARHDVLRTAFEWEDLAQPRQRVHGAVALPWEELDWSGVDEAVQRQDLRALIEQDARQDFDLARPPLMRLTVVHLAARRHHFIWSHHHLLMDAWSVDSLLAEVAASYQGHRNGAALAPPPATPFRAYVDWLAGQDRATARTYWKQALAGLDTPLLLRTAGQALQAGQGQGQGLGRIERSLTATQTEALRRYAKSQRVTLNTLVQGAALLALSSLARRGQPTLGVTVAGRHAPLPGIFDMKGLFINTVPLYARMEAGTPTGEWLRDLQQRNLELREHAFLPLVDIQTCSGLARGTPLFDVIVVFENHPVADELRAGLRDLGVGRVESRHRNAYPLTLVVWPEDELRFLVLHERSVIDPDQAGLLFERLRAVLQAWAGGQAARLDALTWQAPARTGQEGAVADLSATSLHQAVEAWARRQPDTVAVSGAGTALTYAELNRRANRLARRLVELGAGPDRLVGLALERGPETIVAMLAVLKSGAAYLPLDPAYPAQRLAFMVSDANPVVVLTQKSVAARLPSFKHADTAERGGAMAAGLAARVPVMLYLDEANVARGLAALDDHDLALPSHPDSLAYCIYTSGSTGTPKGALLTHRNALRLFDAADSGFDLRRDDVWTWFHSHAFDFSVWEIFGALVHGARVVVVPYLDSRSPAAMLALLERERVTVLSQTPSAFNQLIAEPALADVGARLALRYVVFGGEALDVSRLQPWFKRYGDRQPRLVNMYGITETTVHVTHLDLDARTPADQSIGLPLRDLGWRVLDGAMNEVPPGYEGELYVSGAGLARGYLGRPGLTAERFVPDPHGSRPGARLYRTGDLVTVLPSGQLAYRGRIDSQLKLRGFRIETGEIAARLRAVDGVRDAAVIAQGEGDDKRLVAYVVAAAGAAPGADALRVALRGALPEYMIPAAFLQVEVLPLTANGKLDVAALDALALAAAQDLAGTDHGAGRDDEPTDEIEAAVAAIWRDVLHLDCIAVDADFLDLGGHSLAAVRVAGQVKRQLNVEIPLALMFQLNTVRRLADWIRQAQGQDSEADEMLAMLRELGADDGSGDAV
ncbi:non-ribosomal peptide synthetase [Bordetella sp. N]|uniref:non-ribosomal peptide synthetase n=1 Tax=Bordetella sp. N TaxID=1746199 RepID=UPI00070C3111|nr:non-ribosomal peptide synthetase [Bordetella sp. N]ALM82673.1 hypothetical protein ASB57_06635 [Bordetella sp. N]